MPVITDPEFGEIVVKRQSLAKNISLKIAPDGRLRVTMPLYAPILAAKTLVKTSRKQIRELVSQHQVNFSYIKNHSKTLKNLNLPENKFLKEEELKRLGRNKWYLELMKEEMKERELNEGKTIILEKDKFFKNLFKYFIENKIRLQIFYDRDWSNSGYLIKNLKEFFKFHFCDEDDKKEEEVIRKYGVKIIKAGKNVIKDIIVEDSEIKKNKLIKVYDLDDVLGDIIFQDDNYILICEKDLFFGDSKFIILQIYSTSSISSSSYKGNVITLSEIYLEFFNSSLLFSIFL